MASSDSVKASSDLISNMPELVIDKIHKHLSLHVAAKTSILSRTWRRNWLSCHYLMFDQSFWAKFRKDSVYDWCKGSSVISNVLLLHTGHINSFHLVLPSGLLVEKNVSLTQWMCFLSRTCPKKIALINWAADLSNFVCMPSYIFFCTKLTKLKLRCFVLNAPPFDFKGFLHLRTLELLYVKNGFDMLRSVVAKCPCLVCLTIKHCSGMDLLDVDTPTLQKLTIKTRFHSISLKHCPRLVDMSLCSTKLRMKGIETVVATVKSLATSYELQCLAIEGNLCKFLADGGINTSLPITFNHLYRLCLHEVLLNDPGVFYFTIGMIQSCPSIKELEISVSSNDTTAIQEKYEYNSDNQKLGMLHSAEITGITGSTAELKLIEYVLAVSVVLEELFLKFEEFEDDSKSKVPIELLRYTRASPKAQVICLNI